MHPEKKLEQIGLTLPPVASPIANFVNYRIAGDLLYISGQGTRTSEGVMLTGRLGRDLTTAEGYKHARQAGMNLLAVAKDALGDLGRIEAVVKLLGMVNATPDFDEHPQVINGCSDLLVEVLGKEVGAHARSAIGFSSLPGGISVEIEAIMKIKQ